MRPAGNSNPELVRAARTRSLLSFTAVAGNPTILNVDALLHIAAQSHGEE